MAANDKKIFSPKNTIPFFESGGKLWVRRSRTNKHNFTFSPSLVQIGPAVWEEMFKEIVDDTQCTTDTSPPLMLCSGELKTLREKKKMLLTSNFPFFVFNIFHSMTENSLCFRLHFDLLNFCLLQILPI